jgi:hypothetical protein
MLWRVLSYFSQIFSWWLSLDAKSGEKQFFWWVTLYKKKTGHCMTNANFEPPGMRRNPAELLFFAVFCLYHGTVTN